MSLLADPKSKIQTVAITGVNGFVGKHLVRELVERGHRVVGIGREAAAHQSIANNLYKYWSSDLALDWPTIGAVDSIIHLAGLASVGQSFSQPQQYIEVNSAMITHMFEFYLKQTTKPRFVIISSGAVYSTNQKMPLTEQSKTGHSSPYVIGKMLIELQTAYYRQRGLDCIVMRPFNHFGPGQGPGFLVPDLLHKVRQLNGHDKLSVGNLSTKRDYTDVRDVVRAYQLVATNPKPLPHNLYNVCSGKSTSGEDILQTIFKIKGLGQTITVYPDKDLQRPTDAADIFGDNTLLRKDIGWQPEIPLRTTLKDCVNSDETPQKR
jgi:GDP-4-dehydro-6-deoxy-D-mannose reductase